MTQVTADLEYFKCDVCGVFLHKDIFCDHRRDCKGLNSQELRRSECRLLEAKLSEETRRLIAKRDAGSATMTGQEKAQASSSSSPSPALAATAPPPVTTPSPADDGAVKIHVSVDTMEKRREGRVRRRVVEEYEAKCDADFDQKYPEEKLKALMDFLNEE
eukprot:gene1175-692_t